MPTKGKFTDADLASAPGALPTTDTQEPSLLQKAGNAALDTFTGVGKGFASTANNIGKMMFPDAAARALHMPVPTEEQQQSYFKPKNTAESIGKGAEQVGEFFLPGGAEEGVAEKVGNIGRLTPLIKPAVRSLMAEEVNQAQGGTPGVGAAGGAAGEAVGAGMRAAAPKLAESALHIGAPQRGFGKTPGRAALDLTSGVRPESVLSSGRESMGGLMNDLESHVNEASVRPAPRIAGFLQPPREEIPLHAAPPPRNPQMRPMAFNAEVKPEEPMEPRSGNPMAPISEYPGVNPHYLSGSEHPELSGRVTPLQKPQQVTTRMGTLLRRPEMSASIPPTTEANPNASLRPARNVIAGAMGKAANEEAGTLHGQLGEMSDFLHRGRVSGEPIPENVTPRRLLDLKRGFSDEHLNWNPNIHEEATRAGRGAYGALDRELDRLVPSAAHTNQKISSLIEVLRNADRESRMAPTGQRILGRFGAHTGALTLGGIGAAGGYREGGVPGAIAGGVTGVLAPELIASPEGQMGLARGFNKAQGLRPLVAPALQLNRKRDEEEQ